MPKKATKKLKASGAVPMPLAFIEGCMIYRRIRRRLRNAVRVQTSEGDGLFVTGFTGGYFNRFLQRL